MVIISIRRVENISDMLQHQDDVHSRYGTELFQNYFVKTTSHPGHKIIESDRINIITKHDLIYPYQSLTQGDSVELYFSDEDMYIMGLIVRAYPDRTYDILYWEEDDETEVLLYRIPDDRLNIFSRQITIR